MQSPTGRFGKFPGSFAGVWSMRPILSSLRDVAVCSGRLASIAACEQLELATSRRKLCRLHFVLYRAELCSKLMLILSLSSLQSHSTRPRVIHEGSLLSFPLLASTSTSFTSSSTSSYSSMPLTSTLVSGRRSFGGANVEIEVRSLSASFARERVRS